MAGLLDSPKRRNKGLLDVADTPGLLGNIARTVRQEYAGKTPQQAIADVPASMYENPLVNAAIGFTPVIGDIQSGVEALRSAAGGRWGEAALNGLGVLPFVPAMAGMVKGMGNVEDALKAGGKTQYEIAHEVAQRNAALPVEQGGLGLPPDNTAMDRARALGFSVDDPMVHFSRHGVDVNELDSGKFAVAPFDAVGTHLGTKEAAHERFLNTVATTDQIKGSSYPVLIRKEKQFSDNGVAWNEDVLSNKLRTIGGHNWSDINGGKQTYQQMNQGLREKLFSEFDAIPYVNDVESKGSISFIVDPKNIRSRFAAFDPMRRNESDLLAGLAPWAIPAGLLGVGLLGTQGQYD